MFITLCYVYLWVRFQKGYSLLIRDRLCRLNSPSFSFSLCSSPATAPHSAPDRERLTDLPVPEDSVFLQLGNRAVYVTEPQVLKWSDYCVPLACSPGEPFRAVAQASVENFTQLGVAFIEDRLQLDNGLMPSKIIPVLLQESTLKELLQKKQKTTPSFLISTTKPELIDPQCAQLRKGSLLLTPEIRRRLEERRGSEPLCSTQDLGSVGLEEHSLGSHHHMEGHGHLLHLSSCHECLELENSTILSVKYASAENISDLPDDNSVILDKADETVDELEHDAKASGENCGYDCKGKPPNVLVYTGGCQKRFEAIRQLLIECINMENYVVYPLQPQQALSEPWLDNTTLLVLAENEALTPQLQTCFLTYLSRGGRVLGLSSSLCPAGLSLEVRERRRGQISRLSFTKEDNTEIELSVLAHGKAFIRDPQGGGEVELWGELKGDLCGQERDMVVIRVTHGEDGGEAVLCQVHLETPPVPQSVQSDTYDELKVSNARRYEVLTEILTSLGLSCDLNHIPAPSPVQLLATTQDGKASFMRWLHTRVDQKGLLNLPKMSLRMVSLSGLQDDPMLPNGCLPLVTDSSELHSCNQFSMQTYRENLKTSILGRILLYAEVVTSTMDMLEGLTLHLPKDVSLVAVAARQRQGRGRGKNAWLSPPGCAMFTVSVQVDLSSRLGQRIPFLQHLAALAVVEAVRTLPGYQDIDMRVKWPNDIYYSDLMKLGGVLVTSTVIGSTFHLLIGCGFNVSNSNPTICINDLVQQYNSQHGSSLQPLTCAQLIARSISCLEDLITNFQQGGPDAVLPLYYKRWLHSGTDVHLWSEDGPEAKVVGLDHNGFLQVHSREHGVVSVEPDGNSFDMMKNLVVTKQH
ncbi:biotin--protein ligase isoform X2 [Genypterus blacodes]|uniref:biotin--protein ligase isoform X2 n=1 Tax=Genypterus blacodes TaxID=154954 RepID=UPI003F776F21